MPDTRSTLITLWRVTNRTNPYFGKGSFWALRRKDAIRFQKWWETQSPIPEPELTRQLYTAQIDPQSERILDFRSVPIFPNINKLVENIDGFAELGFTWVIFFGDTPWPGGTNNPAEALYLGDGAVSAQVAE